MLLRVALTFSLMTFISTSGATRAFAATEDAAASASVSPSCKTWFSRKLFRASSFQPEAAHVIAATQAMGGCTAENVAYHGSGIDFTVGGQKITLTLRSIDYPELTE